MIVVCLPKLFFNKAIAARTKAILATSRALPASKAIACIIMYIIVAFTAAPTIISPFIPFFFFLPRAAK